MHELRVYDSVAELIGSPDNPTPMVRLRRVVPAEAKLYLKLEWYNPFGSVKDRPAKFMIEGLQKKGLLKGKTIVEPSSGNTAIALAAIANALGVKVTITIPQAVPEEKIVLLRLLGADVWPTPDSLCPIDHPKDGAIALAHSVINDRKRGHLYVMPNQYENPDNVNAHYETTGPEIWKQTRGRVRAFVAGFGTCGTISGVGRFLKGKNPGVLIVGVQPQKNHRLPGMKNFEESQKPGILDESVIDKSVTVTDSEAYTMTIRLAREESLLVGPTTGAIVHAAVATARETGGMVVAISPDNAFKYTSFLKDYLESSTGVME